MWKEINATILDLVSTKRVHTFNHSHKRKLISESHAGGLGSLCSSFIIGTVSIFVQVQTTCRWYSTPANYRADFKDWLIYSRTFPPPFPSSFQTGTVKAQTAVMLCPVVFIQPSYNSYLSSSSQLLFSTLILGPENETKCPTMNKTTALFSVPHGNLITWYEHFIFSKLLLHQSPFFWHWNEKCGLYRAEPEAPLGSVNYVCVSAPRPPVDRSACDWSGFLLSRSVKSSIPKSQWPGNHSARPRLHSWDLAPHTCSPKLALGGWCD